MVAAVLPCAWREGRRRRSERSGYIISLTHAYPDACLHTIGTPAHALPWNMVHHQMVMYHGVTSQFDNTCMPVEEVSSQSTQSHLCHPVRVTCTDTQHAYISKPHRATHSCKPDNVQCAATRLHHMYVCVSYAYSSCCEGCPSAVYA